MIIPRKWHIYIVDLEPRVGTKPGKQRPCLCIQPTEFCEAGLESAVIIPLTTKVHSKNAYPLRIRVSKGTCALDRESDLLIDQILAWDVELFSEDLGEIPDKLKESVRQAISEFLDLY
jgi:mRNA interferase MazF